MDYLWVRRQRQSSRKKKYSRIHTHSQRHCYKKRKLRERSRRRRRWQQQRSNSITTCTANMHTHIHTRIYTLVYTAKHTYTHNHSQPAARGQNVLLRRRTAGRFIFCVCVCVCGLRSLPHNYACMCASVSAPTVAALVYAGARERVRCGVMRCEWRHGAVQNAAAVDGGELQ